MQAARCLDCPWKFMNVRFWREADIGPTGVECPVLGKADIDGTGDAMPSGPYADNSKSVYGATGRGGENARLSILPSGAR